MSNIDLFSNASPQAPKEPKRRSKKKSLGKTLVVLLAIVAVIALVTPQIVARLSGAPDFPGPGSGSVQVQIEPGETLAQIGNSLKALSVVASVDGFIAAEIITIAGAAGIGKSSMLVPLAAIAAHICDPDEELKPNKTIKYGKW